MEGSFKYTGEGVRLYHLGQVAKNFSPHKPACYKYYTVLDRNHWWAVVITLMSHQLP
jgi:hypothetical protein